MLPWFKLFYFSQFTSKIVAHSLLRKQYVLFLFLQPWLLYKTYWVIWGADLYAYLKKKHNLKSNFYEFVRSYVIQNVKFIVSGTPADYKYAVDWYKSNAIHIRTSMYPTSIIPDYLRSRTKNKKIPLNILLGNSADPENRHSEVIQMLIPYKDIHVTMPLAYGQEENKNKVASEARLYLGNRLNIIENMIPYEEYLEILAEIDIAIFNHTRQQAFSTILMLLATNTKVYLSNESSLMRFFTDLGIVVYDIQDFNLNPIMASVSSRNREIVLELFSEKRMIESLEWLK
jgi:hypothetical protein